LNRKSGVFGCSLCSVQWGHGGNPKAETRNPKETRNSKSEPVGLQEAGSIEGDELELRASAFGFRALAMGFFHSK